MRVLFDIDSEGYLTPVVLDECTPTVNLTRQVRFKDAAVFKCGFDLCEFVNVEGGVRALSHGPEGEDNEEENKGVDTSWRFKIP